MTQSRSQRRYARAAGVVPSVTLDAECAACLAEIMQATGENKSDVVRRLIQEEARSQRISQIWRNFRLSGAKRSIVNQD